MAGERVAIRAAMANAHSRPPRASALIRVRAAGGRAGDNAARRSTSLASHRFSRSSATIQGRGAPAGPPGSVFVQVAGEIARGRRLPNCLIAEVDGAVARAVAVAGTGGAAVAYWGPHQGMFDALGVLAPVEPAAPWITASAAASW